MLPKLVTYGRIEKIDLTIDRDGLRYLLRKSGEIPEGFVIDMDLLEREADWPITVRLTMETALPQSEGRSP